VASLGRGQQFASSVGQGTQAAQAVSNPNLQGQNIGTNTFGGGNGGSVSQSTFGALGKRKLQQAFSINNPSGLPPDILQHCPALILSCEYDKDNNSSMNGCISASLCGWPTRLQKKGATARC